MSIWSLMLDLNADWSEDLNVENSSTAVAMAASTTSAGTAGSLHDVHHAVLVGRAETLGGGQIGYVAGEAPGGFVQRRPRQDRQDPPRRAPAPSLPTPAPICAAVSSQGGVTVGEVVSEPAVTVRGERTLDGHRIPPVTSVSPMPGARMEPAGPPPPRRPRQYRMASTLPGAGNRNR